jgi:hypothetical protein
MNLYDKYLEELGIKYEDLNPVEKETFNQKAFDIKNISVADIKQYVVDNKNAVALQLCNIMDTTEDAEKDLILKARLQNYILFEAFLTSPDRAEKALKDSLKNIQPQKGK